MFFVLASATGLLLPGRSHAQQQSLTNIPGINVPPNFTNRVNRYLTNDLRGASNPETFTNMKIPVLTNRGRRFTNRSDRFLNNGNDPRDPRFVTNLNGQVFTNPRVRLTNQVPPNQRPPNQVPPNQGPDVIPPNEVPPGPLQPGNTVPPKQTLPNNPMRPAIR